MTSNVEFKYEVSYDNTIMQMSGKLAGLKPLNKSTIIAELDGDVLQLHVKRLSSDFFTSDDKGGRHVGTSREDTFSLLKTIFEQTVIWVKLNTDSTETKLIIERDTQISRVENDNMLYIRIPVTLA